MSTIDFKEAKEKLEALCDETASTREPIVLKRPGHEDVALIAADELAGYMKFIAVTARKMEAKPNALELAAEKANRLPKVNREMKDWEALNEYED
jgi:PHD/YefM family antitoxin component YafN of YafNO toxin-antitoxin module